MSEDRILTIDHVTLRLGGITILNDVSLGAGGGEVIGLIGANGSGKSSLLNVISGYYRPVSGSSTVDGHDTVSLSPDRVTRLGVGRSFQSIGRIKQLTVGEYLRLGLEARWEVGIVQAVLALPANRGAERHARDQVSEWASSTNISEFLNVRMGQCPYGVRKMADIVRAVLAGPRLLLLDEPTSGVATEDRKLIAKLIRELASSPTRAVVLVDHDVDFVVDLASSLVALSGGEVISHGPSSEVLSDPRVIATFLGAPSLDSGIGSAP